MQKDYEALESKRRELVAIAEQAIAELGYGAALSAERITGAFAELIAPQIEEARVELITAFSSGRGGGQSRKAGNIILNWRKLLDIFPDVVVASATALSPQWMAIVVALYICNKLLKGAEEDLSDVEATTVLALWRSSNHESKIAEDAGFDKSNDLRASLGLSLLSRLDYESALGRLAELRCIELADGIVRLRERVVIRY